MSEPKKPNMDPKDVHLVIDGVENTAKLFAYNGQLIRTVPCLPHGVSGPRWDIPDGDTPPGLYLAGNCEPTLSTDPWKIHCEYGPMFIYLIEEEGQESKVDRAGCGLHGGGSGLADPMASVQELLPTLGCVRFHNQDILRLENTVKWVKSTGGRVWITVVQKEIA